MAGAPNWNLSIWFGEVLVDKHTCIGFIGLALALTGVCLIEPPAAHAQDQQWLMDDPLVEIDLLDPSDAPIRRYALTASRAPAREVPIPESQNLFCTLAHDHNVVLNYYPDIDTWVFQVDATAEARKVAGGIATCMDLTKAGPASQ